MLAFTARLAPATLVQAEGRRQIAPQVVALSLTHSSLKPDKSGATGLDDAVTRTVFFVLQSSHTQTSSHCNGLDVMTRPETLPRFFISLPQSHGITISSPPSSHCRWLAACSR